MSKLANDLINLIVCGVESVLPQDPQGPGTGTGVDVRDVLSSNSPSTFFFDGPVSVLSLIVNMAIGVGLAVALQWHYRRFATTLSNRNNFAKVFPFVMLTTILIITIVKSSLALSLGLVGALSIVRFRTPIKEPEELAYLFICIAIGLGLGASQTWATLLGTAFIFVSVSLLSVRRRQKQDKNLYLSVNWPAGNGSSGSSSSNGSPGARLDTLNAVLAEHVSLQDLRRVDTRDNALEANYLVEFSSPEQLARLMDRLHQVDERLDVTFLDQERLPNP